MRIPEDKVEEVRASTDIVDVVRDYVRLKRRGSNFVGLCPFHNEKTPSFNVNPGMGIYKCFGCGKGGNVYQFLMEVEGLGFVETVRMLAERAGVPLPEEDTPSDAANEVEAIYHALRFAARFFYEQLTQTDGGKEALAYLLGRGFTPATIKKFGLGYAPDRWDGLLTTAAKNHIAPEVLEQAGLVIPRKSGEGYYDRYRHRVQFPIFSHVGKVLGFGGRILRKEEGQPKYINSPQGRVYDKSRVLYGLSHGKKETRRTEEVILVEGYTDVIALHQAGVENVVASSGTSLTPEQIKLLSRYAKRVLMLYDADAAGANAALRGIDLVLAQGLSVYAVSLPGGEDPDSYVREHGGEAFREYVQQQRQDFVTFKHALARRAGALDTPEGAARVQRETVASIAQMPDPLMQESYLRRAAEVLGVPDITLHNVLQTLSREQRQQQRRQQQRQARRAEAAPVPEAAPFAPPDAQPFAPPDAETGPPPAEAPPQPTYREPLPEEKNLLRLMLENGTPMVEFILGHMGLDEFTEGPARTMVAALIDMYQQDAVEPGRFLDGSHPGPVQSLAAEVLMDRHTPSENWQRMQNIAVPKFNQKLREAAISSMTLLKLDRVDDHIKKHKRRIFQASQSGEEVRPLQEHLMQLLAFRRQVQARAFVNEEA